MITDRIKIFLFSIALGVIAGAFVWDKMHADLKDLEDQSELSVKIADAHDALEYLETQDEAAPIGQNWGELVAISALSDVSLELLNKAESETLQLYQGKIKAWHGVMRGKTGNVLATIYKIQGLIPVQLYWLKIKDGEADIYISVLGA